MFLLTISDAQLRAWPRLDRHKTFIERETESKGGEKGGGKVGREKCRKEEGRDEKKGLSMP